jgi:hypothetical protein
MDIKFDALKKAVDMRFKYKELKKFSMLDTISPPSVFVGSKLRYPMVNVGILSPVERDENAWVYDAEKYWAENNFEIKDVLNLRNSLLNSRFRSRVQDSRLNKRLVEIAKEVAVAMKPVEVEIELANRVNFKVGSDRVLTPHGLRGNLKNAKVVSNAKIHRKVDKVINDEIKASEGISYLYKNKFDEYALSKILSVGVMGLKKNKRFVPTRWSITATDDTIGKEVLKKIRDYKWLEDFEFFYGEFLGNQYIILMFPGVWSFELFELYPPKTNWNPGSDFRASTDYESYSGRKEYAFNTAGGYYATRLPIVEYLDSLKRQASVLVVRIETPTYWAGLGVWVVRESVRKALRNKMEFGSREELIESSKKIGKVKFDFDYSEIFQRSRLLKEGREQRNLGEWF